jgi:thiosulfate reductase cytochrome b subunit
MGIAKNLPPQQKYNAAQQVSYSAIVVMGALSVVTGFAIYKPAQLAWLTALFGGYEGARLLHFALTIGYLLFFVVHLAQVIRAGWNNFRGMVIGYELAGDK